jgi:hypothetical protein
MSNLDEYKALSRKLRFIRFVNSSGGYDEDEDTVLCEMDKLWWAMSKEDRNCIDMVKQHCIECSKQHNDAVDVDIYSKQGPVRNVKA